MFNCQWMVFWFNTNLLALENKRNRTNERVLTDSSRAPGFEHKLMEGRKFDIFFVQYWLLALTNYNSNACSLCLVERVGFEPIQLLASNKHTRILLFKSGATFIESYLTQCSNTANFYQIQTDLAKFPPWSTLFFQNPVLEYYNYLLSIYIGNIMLDVVRNKNNGIEHFSWNQNGRIAFFIFDQIQPMYRWKAYFESTRMDKLEQNGRNFVTSHNRNPWTYEHLIGDTTRFPNFITTRSLFLFAHEPIRMRKMFGTA